MSEETHHEPERGTLPPKDEPEDQSFWDAYWERFRRQDVDDPVERRREGLWERFRRQDVDDPVDERRSRG
jgi:hypothetical protein